MAFDCASRELTFLKRNLGGIRYIDGYLKPIFAPIVIICRMTREKTRRTLKSCSPLFDSWIQSIHHLGASRSTILTYLEGESPVFKCEQEAGTSCKSNTHQNWCQPMLPDRSGYSEVLPLLAQRPLARGGTLWRPKGRRKRISASFKD